MTGEEGAIAKKGFLDLPAELRLKIYDLVIEVHKCPFGHGGIHFPVRRLPRTRILLPCKGERQPSLARVCRATRSELLRGLLQEQEGKSCSDDPSW